MKKALPLFLMLFQVAVFAQHRPFFKSEPHIDANTPAWAKMMYAANPDVYTVDSAYKAYYNNRATEPDVYQVNYQYWRKEVEEYLQPDGHIQLPDPKVEMQENQAWLDYCKAKNGERGTTIWSSIGPYETKGDNTGDPDVSWQANVYCLDIFKSNANILYAGSEAGGIYKTSDKGLNWQLVSLNNTFQTINAIKIHPTNSNIVFAGDGQHIYRSTDGGLTWVTVYTAGSLGVNDFSINPSNTNIILAACDGGLLYSSNGGTTWAKTQNYSCWDLELKPGVDSVVYLLMTNPTAKRCEFYRSGDYGSTFSLRDTGWYTSTDAARNDAGARMTVTPADPNRIYVVLIGNAKTGDDNFISIYRSNDGGNHWANAYGQDGGPYSNSHPNLATIDNTGGYDQGYYNLCIAASHTNADELLVGFLSLWKSTDAGASYTKMGGYGGILDWVHPDQQDMKVLGNDVWLSNDGGVSYSSDFFQSHESRKNGIIASEFWGFGQGWNEDIVTGGRYHNGNTGHKDSYPDGDYLRLGGAEAPTGYVNPGSNLCYFSDICTIRLPDNFNDNAECAGNMSEYPNESYYDTYSGEVEFHPYCYNYIYLTKDNKIYVSKNGGNNYTVLKAFGSDITKQLFSLEISRSNPQVMYVVHQVTNTYSALRKTTDGGATWDSMPVPSGMGNRIITGLAVDATNPDIVWISYGRAANDGKKIWKSVDGAQTWTNLSTSTTLNGHKARYLVHQAGTNGLVYIATDKGVFYIDNTLSDWQLYNSGLPAFAASNIMRPFYRDSKLRLATYGYGLWEAPLVTASAPIAQPTVDKLESYCSRDTFYFEDYSILDHSNATWQWSFNPAPQYVSSTSVRNPKVIFGAVGTYSVTLTIHSGATTDTKTLTNLITIRPSLCGPDTVPGKALALFNNTSYAETAPINSLGTTNHFTITAWVKPVGIQNDYTGIVFTTNGGASGLDFKSNNRLGYHWNGNSGTWSWNNAPFTNTGEWNFVALVITPDSATIYCNGVGKTRVAAHGAVDMTEAGFRIGRDRGYTDRNFNGWMDEVAIYNRALSQNEIRELRHLTRKPAADPSLVAYYQFNEDSNEILDKVGSAHASLVDSALRLTSSAPVGGGTSLRTTIADANLWTFAQQGLATDYLTPLTSPAGEIVVTRLNVSPDVKPDTTTAPEEGYYIINNYGANNVQLGLDSIMFYNLDLGAQYAGQQNNFVLYQRSDNAEGNTWAPKDVADALTTGSNGSVTFANGNGIVSFGQFAIAHAFISGITSVSDDASFRVFPNPVGAGQTIKILASNNEPFTFTLYDVLGRVLLSTTMKGSGVMQLPVVESGTYVYDILQQNHSSTGRLIIVK